MAGYDDERASWVGKSLAVVRAARRGWSRMRRKVGKLSTGQSWFVRSIALLLVGVTLHFSLGPSLQLLARLLEHELDVHKRLFLQRPPQIPANLNEAAKLPARAPAAGGPRAAELALPAAVELLESAGAPFDPWLLFDADQSTAASPGAWRLRLHYAAPRELSHASMVAPQGGTLSVFSEDEAGVTTPVPGLERVVPKSSQAAPWWRQAAEHATRAQRFVIAWSPEQPAAAGPSDLNLWALEAMSAAGRDWNDRILSGDLGAAVRADARPERVEVAHSHLGAVGGEAFELELAQEPRALGRAFLVYELAGLPHWTATRREINGLSVPEPVPWESARAAGDAKAESGGQLQVEEISPEWLRRGANRIRFLPLETPATAVYTVSNVRIIGVAHDGVTSVAVGEQWTGTGAPRKAELRFERPTQPHELSFKLEAPSKAALLLVAGRNKPGLAPAHREQISINLAEMEPGWQRFPLELPVAENFSIELRGGKQELPPVSQLAISGSAAPDRKIEGRRLAVAFPINGDCRDHVAHVRGFVAPFVNESGPPKLFADGREVAANAGFSGSFAARLAEPAARAGKSWSVGLEAVYPDGERLGARVELGPCSVSKPAASAAPGPREDVGAPYRKLVKAKQAEHIEFGGAALDLPKGAVTEDTVITMRPLAAAQVAPLDATMVNVTPGGKAFRLGPHGTKFKKPIKLTLPYDASAIPDGLNERDIYTFYFDEEKGKWQRIGRYGDAQSGKLASISEHFTDFVNATIATPDTPGATAYSPTRLKDLKFANPAAGIALIEPPSANNVGSARLRHDVELPPGRNGVEPSLSFQYDSEAKNGWLGMGWQLALSSIKVDTRFGVPRYGQQQQLYLLDGGMLTEVTNPSDPQGSCSGDCQRFKRRVEGSFQRIERHGDSAATYHWVVTDQGGTKYVYGSQAESRLADPAQGNIAEWLLESVTDTSGNSMTVHYFNDCGATAGGTCQWVQTYLDHVDYTTHTSDPGLAHYHVKFKRDEGKREDVMVDARYGFETRTRYRLASLDVALDDRIIRSYALGYNDVCDGQGNCTLPKENYHKSLLQSIALKGLDGTNELARHGFDYFAMDTNSSGELDVFAAQQDWATLGSADINRTESEDVGLTAFVGAGDPACVSHIGVGANIGSGNEHVRSVLEDVDGDGLPDFIADGSVSFGDRTGLSSRTLTLGPSTLGDSTSLSAGLNLSAHFLEVVGVGADWGWNWTDDIASFQDFNGDRFPDVISLGGVSLYARDGSGNEGWGSSSPLGDFAASADFGDATAIDQLNQNLYATSPLVRWTVPTSGVVSIQGAVALESTNGDGITASITRVYDTRASAGAPLVPNNVAVWSHSLGASDAACTPSGTDACGSGINLRVFAGNRLYFRVDGGSTTAADTTAWSPSLTYLSVCSTSTAIGTSDQACIEETELDDEDREALDDFGLPVFVYALDQDFRTTDFFPADGSRIIPGWVAPVDGTVQIDADITVNANARGMKARVLKRSSSAGATTLLQEVTLPAVGETASLSLSTQVTQGDGLIFAAPFTASFVDPNNLTWHPEVRYTQICGSEGDQRSECRDVSCPGLFDAQLTCELAPGSGGGVPLELVKEQLVAPGQIADTEFGGEAALSLVRVTAPRAGTLTLGGSVAKRATEDLVLLTVEGASRKLSRTFGQDAFGSIVFPDNPLSFDVAEGEGLAFVVYYGSFFDRNGTLSEPGPAVDWQPELAYADDGAQLTPLEVNHVLSTALDPQNGPSGGFRHWSYADYRSDQPLDETKFEPDDQDAKKVVLTRGIPHWEGAGGEIPVPWSVATPVYTGRGADFFIAAGRMKPAFLGGFMPESLGAGPGLDKSTSRTFNVSIGVSFAQFQFGAGPAEAKLLLVDVNGDGLPDSLSRDGVRYQGCGDLPCNGRGEDAAFGAQGGGVPSREPRKTKNSSVKFGISFGSASAPMMHKTSARSRVQYVMTTNASLGQIYGSSNIHKDLVDVNGDGLPDSVENQNNGDLTVQLNLGYGFAPAQTWSVGEFGADIDPANFVDGLLSGAAQATSEALGAAFEAIPFDQFSDDDVFEKPDPASVRVQDNATNNFQIGFAGIGGGLAHSVARMIVDYIDVNGDGLPDRVMKRPQDNFLRVKPNLGERFGAEERWALPGWSVPLEKSFTKEINGGNDALRFTETVSNNAGVGVPLLIPLLVTCISIEVAAQLGIADGASELTWHDVDGDGTLDHVLKLSDSLLRDDADTQKLVVKLNRTGKTNLLRSIDRPLGGHIELDYDRQGNFVDPAQHRDMPANTWVLSSVRTEDGLGNTYAQRFDYHQSGFFDRTERENLGFSQVTTTRGVVECDPPGSSQCELRFGDGSQVEQFYLNQDYYRRGLLAETRESDAAGNLFTRQSFAFAEPTDLTPLTGSNFPAELRNETFWYEGTTSDPNAAVKKRSQQAGKEPGANSRKKYDDYGNLTEMRDDADAELTNDDVLYRVEHQYDLTNYIIRPTNVRVLDPTENVTFRERRATYDAIGRLHTLTNVLVGGRDPQGEPYAGADNPTFTFDQDQFGNLEVFTDPKGFRLTYTYDDELETYRTSTTDSFGYVSTEVPSLLFGGVSSTTDLNKQTISSCFDEFGRIVRVVGAKEQPSEAGVSACDSGVTPTIAYAYSVPDGPLPAFAQTDHLDVQRTDDPVTTVTFIDGLGRTIQTKKDLEKDFDDRTEVGMVVSGAQEFDARGRVHKQGQPLFDTGPATSFVAVEMLRATTTEHDILARVTQVTFPDGTTTTTSYELGPLDDKLWFRTTVTDANQVSRVTYSDTGGTVRAVQEQNSFGNLDAPVIKTLTTRYDYDAMHQLLSVTDAKNNVTSASYDTLGRMFQIVSPDAGRTEWRFDLSGNVGAKITARLAALGQQIGYEYDFSRLKRVDYPDIADTSFEYGGPDDTGDERGNLAGRVKHEESQAGTRDYEYDWMGNVAQESSSVPNIRNPSHDNYTATMRYVYDSFGRIQSLDFPGGGAERVQYRYDHGGRIQSIFGDNTVVDPAQPKANPHSDYLLHVGYDEFEQKTRVVHGNGITTRYSYTPEMRRLNTIDAASRDTFLQQQNLPARPFQKMAYVYDAVGNITQARNDAPFDDRPNASVHIGTTTFDYRYDLANQLRRSTAVMTELAATQWRHSVEYAYDDIGNTETKNQRADVLTKRRGEFVVDHSDNATTYASTYTYGSSRPHAVTHLDERTPPSNKTYPREVSYDESGNQTGWVYKNSERRELRWDSENRIQAVLHNGQFLTRSLYDARGQRSNHVTQGQETVTLNQYVTARSGQQSAYLTKHLYADGMRVADKVQADWLTPTPFYYHPDHLGSTHYVSNAKQDLVQHEEFFASGEQWTDEVDTRFLFHHYVGYAGKEHDDETGYYYFGGRYYDPRMGVWTSPDPILADYLRGKPNGGVYSPLNLHVYAYARQNPIGLIDKNGQWASTTAADFIHVGWIPIVGGLVNVLAEVLHFFGVPAIAPQPVHQMAISRTIGTRFDARTVARIQAQQKDVDKHQGANEQHMHAMMGEDGRTKAQTIAATNTYIAGHLRAAHGAYVNAQKALAAGDAAGHREQMDRFADELGQATHALQDSTSPRHRGFQDWGDHISHAAAEGRYPGAGTREQRELEGVTKWAADQAVSGDITDKSMDQDGFVNLPTRYRD